MTKLGIISTPQSGDVISILTKDGKTLQAQVISWGLEAWGQMWSVCRMSNDQIIQINLSNISTFTLQKKSNMQQDYKIVNESKERYIKTQTNPSPEFIIKKSNKKNTKVEAPVFTRRLSKTSKAVVEEGFGPNHYLSMDPVERARLLASQQQKSSEKTRQAVHDHMIKKDVERIKNEYSMPSFKKRPKN